LSVEGPSKAEISCHDNKDGTVSVSYLPTAPGEYKISVRFGDKHIKGSPYTAKITGELTKYVNLKYQRIWRLSGCCLKSSVIKKFAFATKNYLIKRTTAKKILKGSKEKN
jgi:Filamin/ABP280 repeat